MESNDPWSSVTGFRRAFCVQVSFLQHSAALHPSFWPNDMPLYSYTPFYLSDPQLICGWVVCTLVALVSNTAGNVHVQVSTWMYVSISPGDRPRDRTAGPQAQSNVSCFLELPHCFPKQRHHFTCPPEVYKVPITPHRPQCWVLPVF